MPPTGSKPTLGLAPTYRTTNKGAPALRVLAPLSEKQSSSSLTHRARCTTPTQALLLNYKADITLEKRARPLAASIFRVRAYGAYFARFPKRRSCAYYGGCDFVNAGTAHARRRVLQTSPRFPTPGVGTAHAPCRQQCHHSALTSEKRVGVECAKRVHSCVAVTKTGASAQRVVDLASEFGGWLCGYF